jgi:hypothetical protein
MMVEEDEDESPHVNTDETVRATLLSQGDNLYLGLAKGNPK